jgi:hypothetical protein
MNAATKGNGTMDAKDQDFAGMTDAELMDARDQAANYEAFAVLDMIALEMADRKGGAVIDATTGATYFPS